MRYSEVARDEKAAEPLLISVAKAGEMLDLKAWDVRGLCESGQLRAGKVGNRWRIARASVEEYAERLTASIEGDAS